MIRVVDLRKGYSEAAAPVLAGIDLEVAEGELVCVVGRSGSGKTTLLNIIGGLDAQYEGRVTVAGRVLGQLSDDELSGLRNGTIGFVLQDLALIDGLECRENVMLPALFLPGKVRPKTADLKRRADELLDLVGLAELAEALPAELSGGERQRLGLARALLNRPPLLLVDEITGNLDRETAAEAIDLLVDLNRQHGVTIVAATHDHQVARIADRVLRLHDGELHEDSGAAEEPP